MKSSETQGAAPLETALYGSTRAYAHHDAAGRVALYGSLAEIRGAGQPLRCDPDGVLAELTGAGGSESCLFGAVTRLPPGIRAWSDGDRLASEALNRPEDEASAYDARPSELRLALEQAVLDAWSPKTAIALGGGLDSALLCGLLGERVPADSLVAYSVALAGLPPKGGELARAQQMAERSGATFRVVELDPDALLDTFEQAVIRLERPVVDLRPVAWQRLAAQAAADGFDGLISGRGADVVFFGRPDLMLATDGGPPPFVHRHRKDHRLVKAQLLEDHWVVRGRTLRGLVEPPEDPRPLALRSYVPSDVVAPHAHGTAPLGVRTVFPYLTEAVVRVGLRIPLEHLVHQYSGQRIGKMVLRQEFGSVVPKGLRTLTRSEPMFPPGMRTRRLRHRWAMALDHWLRPERLEPLQVVKATHIGTLLRKYQGAHDEVEWLPFFERTLLRLASLTILAAHFGSRAGSVELSG